MSFASSSSYRSSPRTKGFTVDGLFSTIRGDFDDGIGKYLQQVYAAVAMAMIAFSVGAYVAVSGLFMQGSMLGSFLAIPGMLYIFMAGAENQGTKLSVLLGTGFFVGHSSWPLLMYSMLVDPSLIVTAAVTTAVVFVSFTLSALFARRGSFLYLGYTLLQISLISLLFIFTQSFFGFPGKWVFTFYPYLMLAVACGFVLYDTQLIIERFKLGGIRDPVRDACILFVDAVDIFRHLLLILTENKRNSEKRRN